MYVLNPILTIVELPVKGLPQVQIFALHMYVMCLNAF